LIPIFEIATFSFYGDFSLSCHDSPFLTTIIISDHYHHFWPLSSFLTTITISDHYHYFWPLSSFLTTIIISDHYHHFWPLSLFLTTIIISDHYHQPYRWFDVVQGWKICILIAMWTWFTLISVLHLFQLIYRLQRSLHTFSHVRLKNKFLRPSHNLLYYFFNWCYYKVIIAFAMMGSSSVNLVFQR
jgi:hypothetical protein